ncbi:hypothetical protein B0H19DRAFT_1352633 [Mycena capillaripes]|nr:hypothetical protein B0H19DRAFT_1352633 [Mycena capillaripes]
MSSRIERKCKAFELEERLALSGEGGNRRFAPRAREKVAVLLVTLGLVPTEEQDRDERGNADRREKAAQARDEERVLFVQGYEAQIRRRAGRGVLIPGLEPRPASSQGNGTHDDGGDSGISTVVDSAGPAVTLASERAHVEGDLLREGAL